MTQYLNLRDQLKFYKSYHSNGVNVLIHVIFVPVILFSSIYMLHYLPIYKGFTTAHFVAIIYGSYYMALNLSVGLIGSIILIGMLYVIDSGKITIPLPGCWLLFLSGWIFQFIGHGFFEKRRPALTDNLIQSLIIAPLFVLIELLSLLRLYSTLRRDLKEDVNIIHQYKRNN